MWHCILIFITLTAVRLIFRIPCFVHLWVIPLLGKDTSLWVSGIQTGVITASSNLCLSLYNFCLKREAMSVYTSIWEVCTKPVSFPDLWHLLSNYLNLTYLLAKILLKSCFPHVADLYPEAHYKSKK